MKKSELYELLIKLSSAINKKDEKHADMLRVLYRDLANSKTELEQAESAFELFELLIGPGILKPTDISVLFETIELTGFRYLKEIIENYETYPKEVKITRFSAHRQHVVALGRGFSLKDFQKLCQLYRGEVTFPNQWKLIEDLETDVLTEEKMSTFLQCLKENEVNIDFNQLLLELSEAISKQDEKHVDMLRVLYADLVIIRTDLEEAQSAFELFQLLIVAGILNPTDISILFETIEITGLKYLKKIIEKYQAYPDEVEITRFSKHRQHLVALGRDTSIKNIQIDYLKLTISKNSQLKAITYMENEGSFSEGHLSSLKYLNLLGSKEVSTSKAPMSSQGSGEVSTSKTPMSDKDFNQLLLELSEAISKQDEKHVDMLRVLYADLVIAKLDLNNAKSAFDLFQLLLVEDNLNPTDISILFETIEVTGLKYLKKIIEMYQPYPDEVEITRFSKHRQHLVALGRGFSVKGLQTVCQMYGIPENISTNPWKVITFLEIKSIISEGDLSSLLVHLNPVGSGEVSTSKTPMSEKGSEEVSTSKTPMSDKELYELLVKLSSAISKKDEKHVDMLRVLYRDLANSKTELEKAKSAFELFELLIGPGILKPTDISVLFQTIELTGFRYWKEIIEKYERYPKEVKITRFSAHRQHVVALGRGFSDKDVQKLCHLYRGEVMFPNQWKLIEDLETDVLTEEKMSTVLQCLKENEVNIGSGDVSTSKTPMSSQDSLSMATVREQLQCFDMGQSFYTNVSYQQVEMTDYDRKSRPYRLLNEPGVSMVNMTFGLSGAEKVSKIVLELNHCITTDDVVVDIIVNGTNVIQNLSAPRSNFGRESFNFDAERFNSKYNSIKIVLGSNSPGAYRLSDVVIFVERYVDQLQEDFEETGRNTFCNIREALTVRKKMIKDLRSIAEELDELIVNEVDLYGMETYGAAVVIGESAVDIGAKIWEGIENSEHVTHAEKVFKLDAKYRENMAKCEQKLKDIVVAKGDLNRSKFPLPDEASVSQPVGYGLMSLFASDFTIFSTQFGKSGIKSESEVFKALSFTAIERAFFGIVALSSFKALMKEIAEISKGKPSAIGKRLRQAADSLERDLNIAEAFMQDALTILLQQLREELSSNNLRTVARLLKMMGMFDGIQSKHGSFNCTWNTEWNTIEGTLTQEQFDKLSSILNQIYGELEKRLGTFSRHGQEGQLIDVVIVAHGSVGVPTGEYFDIPTLSNANVTSSNLYFNVPNLLTVTFYQPWGMLINARAIYGIIRGTIQPYQTRVQGTDFIDSLNNFNVLYRDSNVQIPNVWCNRIDENDPAYRELKRYIEWGKDHGLHLRSYIWWRLNSVPASMLTPMVGLLALIHSTKQSNIEVNVHYGLCLDWPRRQVVPPNPLLAINQFHNVIGATFRNPFCMTIDAPGPPR